MSKGHNHNYKSNNKVQNNSVSTAEEGTVTKAESNKTLHLQSWDHLQQYPLVTEYLNKLNSLPYVSYIQARIVSILTFTKAQIDGVAKSSKFTEGIIQRIIKMVSIVDTLFELVVLNEGVDSFIAKLEAHSNKIGMWCLLFLVDYLANIFNILLKEFVLKPFKLTSVTQHSSSAETKKNEELPHVAELTSTTRSLSKDLQSKVQNDYIQPTKNKITARLEPTYNQAIETYKTVSSTYENNLNKSESIPRALYSTGIDIGSLTIEKLNSIQKKTSSEVLTKNQEN